jgi:hypothetical protein
MRVDVKLFTAPGKSVEPKALTPVFHGFIQRSAVKDELLIDVADYSHVIEGPGVMLIGHEGQYAFDRSKGRDGLLYSQRRAQIEDTFTAALRYGVLRALRMCALLEQEESLRGKLEFSASELLVRINDRLRAPSTPETFKRFEPEARSALTALLGGEVGIEPVGTADELFALQVKSRQAGSVSALLAKLPS